MKLNIETSRRIELIDITSEVQEEVRINGIQEGICLYQYQAYDCRHYN